MILSDEDSGTFVCGNCNRLDHYDRLAKYCRYCGKRLVNKGSINKMQMYVVITSDNHVGKTVHAVDEADAMEYFLKKYYSDRVKVYRI